MSSQRQKFATQADTLLLQQLKHIAHQEGRQLQAVVEEAFRDFIEKKTSGKPRPEVMKHFANSLIQYDELYRRLAE